MSFEALPYMKAIAFPHIAMQRWTTNCLSYPRGDFGRKQRRPIRGQRMQQSTETF